MPAHLLRALAPALSWLAPTLLLAGAGCERVAEHVQERMGSEVQQELIGDDWPPQDGRDELDEPPLEIPPWMLPPMLRGHGGGPPILGPDDHELIPSPLDHPSDELDDMDPEDDGLASPRDEERGRERFL